MEELNEIQRFAKLKLEEFVDLRVDQKIARICVWAVHHERVEQGRMLSERQGCTLTEEDIYEVAFFFRKVWQIDESRADRKDCFLCKAVLPTHLERLCRCFRVAQVGVWIPTTTESILWLKKTYPEDWYEHIMETILCQACGDTAEVKAHVVAAKFRKGRSVWRSPKFCQECFKAKQKQKQRDQGEPRFRGPRSRSTPSAPVKSTVETPSATLEELHAKVAQVSPPTAES